MKGFRNLGKSFAKISGRDERERQREGSRNTNENGSSVDTLSRQLKSIDETDEQDDFQADLNLEKENSGKFVEKETRVAELQRLLEVAIDLENTHRRVNSLENGKLPSENFESEEEKEVNQTRLVEVKQGLLKFESLVFNRSKNDHDGEEKYKQEMQKKVDQLKADLEKERNLEKDLLELAQVTIGKSHLRFVLQGLTAFSKARFLQSVVKMQAVYRGRKERKQFRAVLGSAMLIQLFVRKRKERKRLRVEKWNEREAKFERRQRVQLAAVLSIQTLFRKKKSMERRREALALRRITLKIQHRAALQMWSKNLSKMAFETWREYNRRTKLAKSVFGHMLAKYYLQRISFSFKRWWLFSRENYQIKSIGSTRVILRNSGSEMPCLRIYKDYYTRPDRKSLFLTGNLSRGTWRDITVLEHLQTNICSSTTETLSSALPATLSKSSLIPASPNSNHPETTKRTRGVLQNCASRYLLQQTDRSHFREEFQDIPKGQVDWYLPKSVAESKRTSIWNSLSSTEKLHIHNLGSVPAESTHSLSPETSESLIHSLSLYRASRGKQMLNHTHRHLSSP